MFNLNVKKNLARKGRRLHVQPRGWKVLLKAEKKRYIFDYMKVNRLYRQQIP